MRIAGLGRRAVGASSTRARTPGGRGRVAAALLALALAVAACGGDDTPEPDEPEPSAEEPEEPADPEAEEEAEPEPEEMGWEPTEEINFSIPFGPGGGGDQMARMVIEIIEDLGVTDVPITGTNREGGSGAIGWGHVFEQTGNPHSISLTSGSVYTTPLVADTGWTVHDFTTVAILGTDLNILATYPDAPWETAEEYFEHARENGAVFTGGGIVGTQFITVKDLLSQAGVDELIWVDQPGQAEQITALTSESVDAVWNATTNILAQIEGGTLRALAKETGLEALPDVPTLDELGYQANAFQPRGVVLPPDVPAEALDWWIDVFQQVVESDRWQQFTEEVYISPLVLWGDEATQFNAEQHAALEQVLRDEGVID